MVEVSYDAFTEAFLSKIREYEFCRLPQEDRQHIVDGYMKRACAKFSEVCVYEIGIGDDETRNYTFGREDEEVRDDDVVEIIDIVSDGMVYQWLQQFQYKQENLENMITTADYSRYSPAELTYRITNAYKMCKRDFTNRIREYSYRHGDLTDLHL